MRTALVISTYNNPRALALLLESLAGQSDPEFTVFVADDGSGPDTKALIEQYRPRFSQPLVHEWQPDEGYRKARINNRVFAKLGDFALVILVDGDTFVHRDFVDDHKTAHRDWGAELFMGRRIDLGPKLSRSLRPADIANFQRGLSRPLLRSWLQGETRNLTRALRICAPWLQRLLRRDQVHDLLGSNFSVRREWLWRVNGYNEDFQGYWGEDGDLFVRLKNSGVKALGRKSFAIQYHLDHPRLEPTVANLARYRAALADPSYIRCQRGIRAD